MGELPGDARLGAIRLRVGDVDLQRRFYETAIGLRTLGRRRRRHGARRRGRRAARRARRRSGRAASAARTTGLFHLALLTPTRADLARALRRVVDAGWRLSGASDHLVSEALYLDDPEGNGIELYRDRPRDEWPVADGVLQMATLPLDLESLLAEPWPSDADGGDAGRDDARPRPSPGRRPRRRRGVLGRRARLRHDRTARVRGGPLLLAAAGRGSPRPPREFIRLFGDHNAPMYAEAMAAYYQNGPRQGWPDSSSARTPRPIPGKTSPRRSPCISTWSPCSTRRPICSSRSRRTSAAGR